MTGTGLHGQVGLANETTAYGTFTVPSKFFEPTGAVPLKEVKNAQQGGGLSAGSLAQLGSKRVVTTRAGTASLPIEATRTGLGLILDHAFGGSVVPVQQAATTAYLQARPLADNAGKSLTMQVGVPEATVAGTVKSFTGRGGKITSFEISCGVDEIAMIALELDMQRVSDVETIAAPSYPTRNLFHFGQMSVKLGTTSANAVPISGVKKASVKLERGQDTSRFYAGAGGFKAEPLGNDWVKATASLDFDFVDKTLLADPFSTDSPRYLVVEWVGPLITGTNYERLTLILPMVFVDGETPSIDGPGITSNSVPLVAQRDGVNPLITCEYMSTDTTL